MRYSTVYSSRNQNHSDSGVLNSNKIFSTAYTTNDNIRKMVQWHQGLYDSCVRQKFSGKSVYNQREFNSLKGAIEAIYTANHFVALEDFLYSAKAVPGLLPSDEPNRPKPNHDLTIPYCELLAKWLDQAIIDDKIELSREHRAISRCFSMESYLHILRHWPNDGSWNEIKRIAIRIYGEMNEQDPDVEDELYQFLRQSWNYPSAFDALAAKEENPANEHDIQRLTQLMQFLSKWGVYRRYQDRPRNQEMYERFGRIVQDLKEYNEDIYEQLRDRCVELHLDGYIKTKMWQIFSIQEESPLQSVQDRSKEQQLLYIRRNYNPTDRSWRMWLKELNDKEMFDEICKCFCEDVYPNHNLWQLGFMLCSFAGMTNQDMGCEFLKKIYENKKYLMRNAAEQCVMLCARHLVSNTNVPIDEVIRKYESVPEEYVQRLLSTLAITVNYKNNIIYLKNHLLECVRKVNPDNEQELIAMINLIRRYLFNSRNLRQRILPVGDIMEKLAQSFRLNRSTLTFECLSNLNVFVSCMNFVADMVTVESRENYRDFLLAAKKTNHKERANLLILQYWDSENI